VVARADSPEVLELFESALGLVEIIARQVGRAIGHGADLDELKSFAREGLLDAARRFEPERGVPFKAYANYRVRGAVIDGIRSLGRLPRRAHQRLNGYRSASNYSEGALEDAQAPAAPGATRADADAALGEHLAAMATAVAAGLLATTAHGEDGEATGVAPGDNPEDALSNAELMHVVREALSDLPAEEAELVRRHYLEGERFDHVARDLGLSKSWASRLHTRAVKRLTKRLRGLTD
jgi:RNA polymerase sigma factor for flagellar operon FliA